MCFARLGFAFLSMASEVWRGHTEEAAVNLRIANDDMLREEYI
jgi:hypothetical protein